MSENEQKAGCVDVLRDVIRWAESRCPCHEETPDPCTLCDATVASGTCKAVDATFPRKLLGDMRAALEAAALSPARSGEADAWLVTWQGGPGKRRGKAFYNAEEAREYFEWRDTPSNEARIEPLYLAPRNESSGVSPGGGRVSCCVQHPEDFPCYVCYPDRYPLPTAAVPETYATTTLTLPAPQDSVRVGDGAFRAEIERIAGDFVPDHDRDAPLALAEMRDALNNAIANIPTTPAPAAGADGEDRKMLREVLEDLDYSSWECPKCGHSEDCATMDAAYMLRHYLSDGAGQSAGGGR